MKLSFSWYLGSIIWVCGLKKKKVANFDVLMYMVIVLALPKSCKISYLFMAGHYITVLEQIGSKNP